MISLRNHNIADYIIGAVLIVSPYLFGFSHVDAARNLFLIGGISAFAQTKKPVTAVKTTAAKPAAKPATKPAAKPASPGGLKSITDSASYAIGVSVANFYQQQGMNAQAVEDVLGKKKVLLDDQQCNTVMMRVMMQAQEGKAKGQIEAGQKFLAENGKRIPRLIFCR